MIEIKKGKRPESCSSCYKYSRDIPTYVVACDNEGSRMSLQFCESCLMKLRRKLNEFCDDLYEEKKNEKDMLKLMKETEEEDSLFEKAVDKLKGSIPKIEKLIKDGNNKLSEIEEQYHTNEFDGFDRIVAQSILNQDRTHTEQLIKKIEGQLFIINSSDKYIGKINNHLFSHVRRNLEKLIECENNQDITEVNYIFGSIKNLLQKTFTEKESLEIYDIIKLYIKSGV